MPVRLFLDLYVQGFHLIHLRVKSAHLLIISCFSLRKIIIKVAMIGCQAMSHGGQIDNLCSQAVYGVAIARDH